MKHVFLLSLIMIGLIIVLTCSVNAQTVGNELYRVGVNDMLNITVVGYPNLSLRATVTTDGTIAYPHLGSVYVKDKTLQDIEKELTEKLGDGYLKFPVVSVSLLMATSKRIFIHGEVAKIGAIPYEKDITVIKALSIAGGIRENGLYGKLKIRRAQEGSEGYKNIVEEDVINGIIKSKKIEDLLLQPDDILNVERNQTFLIKGEVAKRGRFILEQDMTVLRALLEAGGVSDSGLYGTIKVRRKQEGVPGGYKDLVESKLDNGRIKSGEVEDLLLQPDDILNVERNQTFLIKGEVAKRGRFILEQDMTVLRALLEAGGVSDSGLYGTIKVRRKQEGAPGGYKDLVESKLDDGDVMSREVEDLLLQPDDILNVERNQTFLIKGEVAKRGRFILEQDMTVLRALLEAGGVSDSGLYGTIKVRRKQEGVPGGYKDLVESKLDDGNVMSREVEDLLLQPDDILSVERNHTYFIYGEANRTGEFIIQNDMTVFKAITIAGGFSKWGSASKVRVLRPAGDGESLITIKVDIDKVLKGDASADLMLQQGDTIVLSKGIF